VTQGNTVMHAAATAYRACLREQSHCDTKLAQHCHGHRPHGVNTPTCRRLGSQTVLAIRNQFAFPDSEEHHLCVERGMWMPCVTALQSRRID